MLHFHVLMALATAVLVSLPAVTWAAVVVSGDDSTMILINFGRSNYKVGGHASNNNPMFNTKDNTLAASSDYMHDSGLPYGYNAGTDHRQYGWSGGLALNQDTYFDPQAYSGNTDWRYECAVRFPKSKKFEVQVSKGKYQVEVTYGSRFSDSASEIKVEGINPERKGVKSLVKLAKDKFDTKTYYDVEVKDGKMTFQLTKSGQAKTRIMYLKIIQGFDVYGEMWDGSQIDGWSRKPRNNGNYYPLTETGAGRLSGSKNYNADDNFRFYGMFGANEAEIMEREFALPAHTVVRIQVRYLAADSWDGSEHAFMKVDGDYVWKTPQMRPNSRCSGGFTPMNAYNLYNPWAGWQRGWNDKCFFDADITFLHKSTTMKLQIGSTITGSKSDESWGFDNMIVSIHEAPTTFATKPSINFNYGSPVSTVMSYVEDNKLSFKGETIGAVNRLGGGFGITTRTGRNAGQLVETSGPALTVTQKGTFWKTTNGGANSYVIPMPVGEKLNVEAMCAEAPEDGSSGAAGDGAGSSTGSSTGGGRGKSIDAIFANPTSAGYDFFDYDNFDDPDGEGKYDKWSCRNSCAHTPQIKCNDPAHPAFHGPCCLSMTSSWGRNWEWGSNRETSGSSIQKSDRFKARDYPYMCMAYRIPPGARLAMLIKSNYGWRSVRLSNTWNSGYGEIASFREGMYQPALMDDNEWHYDCIEFKAQFDKRIGNTNDKWVYGIIWHDGQNSKFWIDQFVLSKTPVPPNLYQKAVSVPTPLLLVKVNSLQPLETYTFGINKNDESESAALAAQEKQIVQEPQLMYARYDILCFMQGIIEQIGEDRWNQWSLRWQTSHECSFQRTPGANRRVHPIMMANGVPMRWDTYNHYIYPQKNSGAYETRWGSVSGMHWRTNWGDGHANAPYVDFLNGHTHYDGSYLRVSQYKVPDDTLCVVEGMIRLNIPLAKDTSKALFRLKEHCRPDRPILFNVNAHENNLAFSLMPSGEMFFAGDGRIVHNWASLQGVTFDVTPGLELTDFGRYFSSTTSRASSRYPGIAPKGAYEIQTTGEGANERIKKLGDCGQWYTQRIDATSSLACGTACSETSDCGSFTFGEAKGCRISSCYAGKGEKWDLSGGSGGSAGQRQYTARDGTVVNTYYNTWANSNYYNIIDMFDDSEMTGTGKSWGGAKNCRSSTVHTCYWLAGGGNGDITVTFPEPRDVGVVEIRPFGRPDAENNFIVYYKHQNGQWISVSGGEVNTATYEIGDTWSTEDVIGGSGLPVKAKEWKIWIRKKKSYNVLEEIAFFKPAPFTEGCEAAMSKGVVKCPIIGDHVNPSKCVFPFKYEGKEYTKCTNANNGNQLWCAHDAVYKAPVDPWVKVFEEAVGSANGDQFDNSDIRTLNLKEPPFDVTKGNYKVRIAWGNGKKQEFTVPAGKNIFNQAFSGNREDFSVTDVVGTHYSGSATFCHACKKNGYKWGDTCWGLTTDTQRACGCNSGGWAGVGIYYGGYKNPNICGGQGGGFVGYKTNGQQKGNLGSVGLVISIMSNDDSSDTKTSSECNYDQYSDDENDKGQINLSFDDKATGKNVENGGIQILQLRNNVKCKSKDIDLSRPAGTPVTTIDDCAVKCANHGRCQYFTYDGTDKCIAEVTSDKTCSEGWITAPETNFYELIPQNSLDQWRSPSYKVHGNKVCIVTGRVYSVDEETRWDEETILTLPPLCRPTQRLVFTVRSGSIGTPSRVDVLPSGKIIWMKGESPWYSGGWLQLDGISFGTSAHGNVLPVPKSGWHDKYMKVKAYASNYRGIKTKVDDGGAPLVITGPDDRESGVDTSRATQSEHAGKAAIRMISEDVVPNNVAGLDTMELRDGIELPISWTFDLFIKLPLAQSTGSQQRVGYRALFAGVGAPGADMGNYHVAVKMSEKHADLGVYTTGFGSSADPAGNPCTSNIFYPSGIDLEDTSIFAKKDGVYLDQWYRMTIVGANGEERFYIDGTLRGISKCQLTSELSFVGNFITRDFNDKLIKGGAYQPWGKFALVKIYDYPLHRDGVNMLASYGPTSECDDGCEQTPCAELSISKSCSMKSISSSGETSSEGSSDGSGEDMEELEGSVGEAQGCIWSDSLVHLRNKNDLWKLDESFHVIQSTSIDLRSLLNQKVSATANVIWDTDVPSGSQHSTSLHVTILTPAKENAVGVKEFAVAEGFKYRASAQIKFNQDNACAIAKFGWKIGASGPVVAWKDEMKKDTWYTLSHAWKSDFGGEDSIELYMEGCKSGTAIIIANFEIRQWTTSITVERMLLQENVASKSNYLSRSSFAGTPITTTDENGNNGEDGSDDNEQDESTVAVINSPTPVYIKTSMAQMTIKNNQRNIEGMIVQKDTPFCIHSKWILPKPQMAFVGPAYSGAKLIISTTSTINKARFRVYDDVDIDEDGIPSVSSYEDEDHYVEPGQIMSITLDNSDARVISVFSDAPVIVGITRVKPGDGHVYKYKQEGDTATEHKISKTLPNGQVEYQKDEYCNSMMESFRPPRDYGLKVFLPKTRMKEILNVMKDKQATGYNYYIQTPKLLIGQTIPVYNFHPDFANEQFTTVQFSKAQDLDELEELREPGMWSSTKEIDSSALSNRMIMLLNMQGGKIINPPEWKHEHFSNTGGSMNLAWWYEDPLFDKSKIAMFHVVIDQWDQSNPICEEYEKDNRKCWKSLPSCYVSDNYNTLGKKWKRSKSNPIATCIYDKYRGSDTLSVQHGSDGWSMVVSRLVNTTNYRMKIMAIGHKDEQIKSCTIENGVGEGNCMIGPPGIYKYYETSRPSKPSQPLHFTEVQSTQTGGTAEFTWNDPVDYGGGDLVNFYIYGFNKNTNGTLPIVSTIDFITSILLNQEKNIDNPTKSGRAVMLKAFTTYTFQVTAANSAEWCFGDGLRSTSVETSTIYYNSAEQITIVPILANPTGGSIEIDWSGYYYQEKSVQDPVSKDKTINVLMASALDSGGTDVTSYVIVSTYVSPTIMNNIPLVTWIDFEGGANQNQIVDRMNNNNKGSGTNNIQVIGEESNVQLRYGSVLPGISNYGRFDKQMHVVIPLDLSDLGPYKQNGQLAKDGEPSYYNTYVGKNKKLTISTWIRPMGSGTSQKERMVLALGDVIKDKSPSNIGYSAILKINRNSKPEFIVPSEKENDFTSIESKNDIQYQEWTHLVGTYSHGCLTLYVNGEYSGRTCGKKLPPASDGTTYQLHVVKSAIENEAKTLSVPNGQLYLGGIPPHRNWKEHRWYGDIADVRIYTVDLSVKELNHLLVSWYPKEKLQYKHQRGIITTRQIDELEYPTNPSTLINDLIPNTHYEFAVRAYSYVPPGNKHLLMIAHDDCSFSYPFATPFHTNINKAQDTKINHERGITISFYMKVIKLSSDGTWSFQNFVELFAKENEFQDNDNQRVLFKLGLESTTQMTLSNADGVPLLDSSAPIGSWTYNQWEYITIQLVHTQKDQNLLNLYVNGYLVQSGELDSVVGCTITGMKFSNPIPYKRANIALDDIRLYRGDNMKLELIRKMMKETPAHYMDEHYLSQDLLWRGGEAAGWSLSTQITFDDGAYSLDTTTVVILNEEVDATEIPLLEQQKQAVLQINEKYLKVEYSNRGVAILSPAIRSSTRPPSPPTPPLFGPCLPKSSESNPPCREFEEMIVDWSHISFDWGGLPSVTPTMKLNDDGSPDQLIYPTLFVWHNPVDGGGYILAQSSSSYITIPNYNFQDVYNSKGDAQSFDSPNGMSHMMKPIKSSSGDNKQLHIEGWTFQSSETTCNAGIMIPGKEWYLNDQLWKEREMNVVQLSENPEYGRSHNVMYLQSSSTPSSSTRSTAKCCIESTLSHSLLSDHIYTVSVEVGGFMTSTGYHIEIKALVDDNNPKNNIILGSIGSHQSSNAPIGPPVRNDLPTVVTITFDMRDFPASIVGKECQIIFYESTRSSSSDESTSTSNEIGFSHYHKISMIHGIGTSLPIASLNMTNSNEKYRLSFTIGTSLGESSFSPSLIMTEKINTLEKPLPPKFLTGSRDTKEYADLQNSVYKKYRMSGSKNYKYAKVTIQFTSLMNRQNEWVGSGNGVMEDVGLYIENQFICNMTTTCSKLNELETQHTFKDGSGTATDFWFLNGAVDLTQRERYGTDRLVTRFELKLPYKRLYAVQLKAYNEAYESKLSDTITVEAPSNCPSAFEGEQCDKLIICPPMQRSSLCTQKIPITMSVTGFTRETFNKELYLNAQAKFLGIPRKDIQCPDNQPIWNEDGTVGTITYEVSSSKGGVSNIQTAIKSLKSPLQRPVVSIITLPGTIGTFRESDFKYGYTKYIFGTDSIEDDMKRVSLATTKHDTEKMKINVEITVIADDEYHAAIISEKTKSLYGPSDPKISSSVTLSGLKEGDLNKKNAQQLLAKQYNIVPASNVQIKSISGEPPKIDFVIVNVDENHVTSVQNLIKETSTPSGTATLQNNLKTSVTPPITTNLTTITEPTYQSTPKKTESGLSDLITNVNTKTQETANAAGESYTPLDVSGVSADSNDLVIQDGPFESMKKTIADSYADAGQANPTVPKISSSLTLNGLKEGDLDKNNAQQLLAKHYNIIPASNVQILNVTWTNNSTKVQFMITNVDEKNVKAITNSIQNTDKAELQQNLFSITPPVTTKLIALSKPTVTTTGVMDPEAQKGIKDPEIKKEPGTPSEADVVQLSDPSKITEKMDELSKKRKVKSSIILPGIEGKSMTRADAKKVLAEFLGVDESTIQITSNWNDTMTDLQINFEISTNVGSDQIALTTKLTTIDQAKMQTALRNQKVLKETETLIPVKAAAVEQIETPMYLKIVAPNEEYWVDGKMPTIKKCSINTTQNIVLEGIENNGEIPTLECDQTTLAAMGSAASSSMINVQSGKTMSIIGLTLKSSVQMSEGNGGLLNVNKESTVVLRQVTLIDGYTKNGDGGAINIQAGGVLNAEGLEIENGRTENGSGGALACAGTCSLIGSLNKITNSVASKGGGIAVLPGGVMNIVNKEESATESAKSASLALTNNQADEGGGIYLDDGSSLIISGKDAEVKVKYNTATKGGGGFYAVNANIQVINDAKELTVNQNKAKDGGGFYLIGSTILGTKVENNYATQNGGGVYFGTSDETTTVVSKLYASTINENIADGNGGGVYVNDPMGLVIENAQIESNVAEGHGGGLAVEGSGTNTMTRLTFTDGTSNITKNTAVRGEGGGISMIGCIAQLKTGMTISENKAAIGGGISAKQSKIIFDVGTEIAGNTAYMGGGVSLTDVDIESVDNNENDQLKISNNHALQTIQMPTGSKQNLVIDKIGQDQLEVSKSLLVQCMKPGALQPCLGSSVSTMTFQLKEAVDTENGAAADGGQRRLGTKEDTLINTMTDDDYQKIIVAVFKNVDAPGALATNADDITLLHVVYDDTTDTKTVLFSHSGFKVDFASKLNAVRGAAAAAEKAYGVSGSPEENNALSVTLKELSDKVAPKFANELYECNTIRLPISDFITQKPGSTCVYDTECDVEKDDGTISKTTCDVLTPSKATVTDETGVDVETTKTCHPSEAVGHTNNAWCNDQQWSSVDGTAEGGRLPAPTHASTHCTYTTCSSKLVMDGASDIQQGGYGGGVFYQSRGNKKSTLKNLLVEKCDADNGGGGLYTSRTAGTFTNMQIDQCVSRKNGGGIMIERQSFESSKTLHMINMKLSHNKADENGGGACIRDHATVQLRNATFNQNEAERNGGGLSLQSTSYATIMKTEMRSNSAFMNGGGISIDLSKMNMKTTKMIQNAVGKCRDAKKIDITCLDYTAENKQIQTSGSGGAIYISGDEENSKDSDAATLVISENSEFHSNTAKGSSDQKGKGGSIAAINYAVLNIRKTLFIGYVTPTQSNNNQSLTTESSQTSTTNDNGNSNSNGNSNDNDSNETPKDVNGLASEGGGIYLANNAKATMNTISFQNMNADDSGGCITILDHSTVQLNHLNIHNVASKKGGGIYVEQSSVTSMQYISMTSATSMTGSGLYSLSSILHLYEEALKITQGSNLLSWNSQFMEYTNGGNGNNNNNNKNELNGGGLYLEKTTLITSTIKKNDYHIICTNMTSTNGGCLYSYDTFTDESSKGLQMKASNCHSNGNGGVLYLTSSSSSSSSSSTTNTTTSSLFQLSNSILNNNRAVSGGGGVAFINYGIEFLMTNTIANENVAMHGGVVAIESEESSSAKISTVRMVESTYKKNMAINQDVGGGVIYGNKANIQIQSCEYYENSVKNGKGGVLTYIGYQATSLYVTDSQFHSNTASIGGVMYTTVKNERKNVLNATVLNTVYKNNHATKDGGVLYVEGHDISWTTQMNQMYYTMGDVKATTENKKTMRLKTKECDAVDGCTSSLVAYVYMNNIQFQSNSADESGGSIYMSYSNVILNQYTDMNGYAVDSGGFGYISAQSNFISHDGKIDDTRVNSKSGQGGSFDINSGSYVYMENVKMHSKVGEAARKKSPYYCTTEECYSAFVGGSLYITDSETSVYLKKSMINGHIVDGEEGLGGGIYVTTNAKLIMDTTTVQYCNGTSGGGIFIGSNTNVEIIKKSKIHECLSLYEAAGIYIQRATLLVDDSTLSNNFCEGDGGGIYIDAGSTLNVDNSKLLSNQAARGGGIFIGRQSIFNTKKTIYESNAADEDGGAITGEDNYRQSFNIDSCTFSKNTAFDGMGGAVHLNRASATLANCDFNENIASTGGAISLYGYVGGSRTSAKDQERTNRIRTKLVLKGKSNIFSKNHAIMKYKSNGYARGGAVYIGGTSLYDSSNAESVIYQQNKAQAGGAIFITASSESIFYHTTFEQNVAERLITGSSGGGSNTGRRSTTTLDGNGGAIYFEGDHWKAKDASKDSTNIDVFHTKVVFRENSAPDGCGGAVFLSYIRGSDNKNGKLFGTTTGFDNNNAKSGSGIFWQFRGESSKLTQRTNKKSLQSFHSDVSQLKVAGSGLMGGFLATSAVSIRVKQGGLPKNPIHDATAKNVGEYPSSYQRWFVHLEANGDWSLDANKQKKQQQLSRILHNEQFNTKSGHIVENKITGARTQLQTIDYYGNNALDRGTTYCSASSSDPSIIVPTGNVFTAAVTNPTTKQIEEGVISYQSLSMLGKIGSVSNITINCGNSLSSLKKGDMGGISFETEITKCDPGEELNGAQICEYCKEKYYSIDGYKCLPCPTGGICKTRLGTSEPPIYRGISRPGILPGFWLYDAPKWLMNRKDYCWDTQNKCGDLPGCRHGLCQFRNNKCVEGGNETWDNDRIHQCITKEYIYKCPMDDISCKGTLLSKNEQYPSSVDQNATRRFLSSSNVTSSEDLEVYYPGRPSCGSESRNLSYGPIYCDDTCNEGYEGVKCKTCKENWFRTADHSCVPCSGDLDPEVTKVIYGIGLVCALIFMIALIAIYLRNDSGAPIWNCLFRPCLAIVDQFSTGGKAKRTAARIKKARAGAVSPSGGGGGGEDGDAKGHATGRQMVLRWEKLKIFLAWQQIFGQMKWNYNIPWPKEVATYMRLYAVFQLDILSLLPLDCLQRTDFYFGLVFSLIVPCLCLVMIAILHNCGKASYRTKLNRLPRKCVKSGKEIRGHWMPTMEAKKLSTTLAKAGLIEVFGQKKVTSAMVSMEMAEAHQPMLPYATSYSRGNNASSATTLSKQSLREVLKHNILQFRKRVRKRIDHMQYVSKLWKMFFLLLLLTYPSVSMRVTRFFSCETIGHVSYLSIDSRTVCKDELWHGYLIVALIGCILYVVGTPVLFFGLVSSARNMGIKWKLQQCSMAPQLEKRLLIEAKTDANYSFEFW